MSRLPALLRAALLALLAAAVLFPSLWSPRVLRGRVLRVADAAALARADSLLLGKAPAALVWSGAAAPDAAALETLAAASQRAPIFLIQPPRPHLLEAFTSARPHALRTAAVAFRLRAAPGEAVRVALREGGVEVDSLTLRAGAGGDAQGAFRVRPAAQGWREWTVTARWANRDSSFAVSGAWVDSASTPRVLVRAGFPDWEAKFVTRALEESGARVEENLALGRGLAVAEGSATLDAAHLARVDAVLVLDGAPLGPGEARVLAAWAAQGGGVLLAGDRAAAGEAFGLPRPAGAAATIDGGSIAWSLPPELAPLPAERLGTAAEPLSGSAPGVFSGARSGQRQLLALRPLGRGRAAALALTETWRWRMESGRLAEHREFWRSLVDWLASGAATPPAVELPATTGAVGSAQRFRVYADAASSPPALLVTRPSGGVDTLALERDSAGAGVYRGSLIPARAGVYRFSFAGHGVAAAFAAMPGAPAPAAAWARAARLAGLSGGALLPAASIATRLGALGDHGAAGPHLDPRLLLALLVLLGGAEWAIRRLRGRA